MEKISITTLATTHCVHCIRNGGDATQDTLATSHGGNVVMFLGGHRSVKEAREQSGEPVIAGRCPEHASVPMMGANFGPWREPMGLKVFNSYTVLRKGG